MLDVLKNKEWALTVAVATAALATLEDNAAVLPDWLSATFLPVVIIVAGFITRLNVWSAHSAQDSEQV